MRWVLYGASVSISILIILILAQALDEKCKVKCIRNRIDIATQFFPINV